MVQPKRARAPSDPFLDAPQSRSLGSASHSPNSESLLATASTEGDEPPSPIAPDGDTSSPLLPDEDMFDNAEDQYLRIWTSPDLTNPEILHILEIFPAFVSRRPLPRFTVSAPRHADVEEGEDEGAEGRQIRFGTGSMWISSKERGDFWEGGWWSKFVMWWRRLFC